MLLRYSRNNYERGMEHPTENPTRAAEYLKELNRIIDTQQELLERQRGRIEELEQQVSDLCTQNACLQERYQRHMATCRLLQGTNSLVTLGAVKEHLTQEKKHVSLPTEILGNPVRLESAGHRRDVSRLAWKSASFGYSKN